MRGAFLAAFLVVGCGGGDDGGELPDAMPPEPATFRVELRNNTPMALRHEYVGNETPDVFGAKLIGVTLGENYGEGAPDVGEQVVYANPGCEELATCSPADLDYVELQQATADVNAELGAVEYEVQPGEYHTVFMRWQPDGEEVANAFYRMDVWQDGATVELVWGSSEMFVDLSSPAVVPPGSSVRLVLYYDLTNLVLHNQSIDGCEVTGAPSCYSEGMDRWFIIGDPEFGGSAIVE